MCLLVGVLVVIAVWMQRPKKAKLFIRLNKSEKKQNRRRKKWWRIKTTTTTIKFFISKNLALVFSSCLSRSLPFKVDVATKSYWIFLCIGWLLLLLVFLRSPMQRVNIVWNPFLAKEKNKKKYHRNMLIWANWYIYFERDIIFLFVSLIILETERPISVSLFSVYDCISLCLKPMRTHIIKYTYVCLCVCVYAMHTHSTNLKTDRMDWVATKSGLYFHISQDQLLNWF